MKSKLLILIVLIIALAAMAAPVMAGTTTTITGNPASITGVTVKSGSETLALGSLTIGAANSGTAVITVSNNVGNGYTISVGDSESATKTTNSGIMREYDGTTYGTGYLGTAMTADANVDAATFYDHSPQSLGQSPVVVITSVAGNKYVQDHDITMKFSQTVLVTDPHLGGSSTYRIIPSFTIATT